MAKNVIQFPEERSLRKRLVERTQDRKAVLGLSIASVLMVSVFLNEWLIVRKPTAVNAGGSRQVASLDAATLAKDIKWEHSVAGQLASADLKQEVKLAEKPSLRDEMVFGFLQGKYGVKVSKGKIESIEFLNAMAGDKPLKIEDRAEFLQKYQGLFAKSFQQVSLQSQSEDKEIYTLLDESKTIVGHAQLSLDHEGRVLSVQVIE